MSMAYSDEEVREMRRKNSVLVPKKQLEGYYKKVEELEKLENDLRKLAEVKKKLRDRLYHKENSILGGNVVDDFINEIEELLKRG